MYSLMLNDYGLIGDIKNNVSKTHISMTLVGVSVQ